MSFWGTHYEDRDEFERDLEADDPTTYHEALEENPLTRIAEAMLDGSRAEMERISDTLREVK